MPVCSRPFHHACSPWSLPYPTILSVFLFSARICAWFSLPLSISVRLRQHAPHLCASAYQSFVPFSPLLYPVYHPSPCPGDSFVTIGIRMPSSRLVSHFSQLMYQFLIASPLISYLRSILCHVPSIRISRKIHWIFAYYIPERKENVSTFKDTHMQTRITSSMLTWYRIVLFVMSYFTLHSQLSRIHEAIYARFSIEALPKYSNCFFSVNTLHMFACRYDFTIQHARIAVRVFLRMANVTK